MRNHLAWALPRLAVAIGFVMFFAHTVGADPAPEPMPTDPAQAGSAEEAAEASSPAPVPTEAGAAATDGTDSGGELPDPGAASTDPSGPADVAAADAPAFPVLATLKGGARSAEVPAWPVTSVPRPPVCGPALASAPLYIGEKEGFAKLGGLVKGVALGMLGKLVSTASGGIVDVGGKKAEKPDMFEDPVKSDKLELDFPGADTRLEVGGTLARDGMVLSTRLDDAPGKGTVHAVYLENEDCERIWPFAHWTYELWGEWSLSVSWTRTVDTYQDGQLIDRDVSSGGFEKAGSALLDSGSGFVDLATGSGTLPPGLDLAELRRYQEKLGEELPEPIWRTLGFGAPTSGARGMALPFKASPEQVRDIAEGRMIAVVHVTREVGDRFQTVGLPMRIVRGEGTELGFEAILPE